MFDLVLRHARVDGHSGPVDLGVRGGTIVAMEPDLPHDGPQEDLAGRYTFPGFVETHIHLDKACILDRCPVRQGTLAEAISLTAEAKRAFTTEDVYRRGQRVLEQAVLQGTTVLRTFVEVDPRAGMRSFEAVKALKSDYAWAMDIQICAFAQEGLTQEMETYALLDQALADGADLVGGCPYTDPDPHRHITLIFDLAEKHASAVDFHTDFDLKPHLSNLDRIIDETERRGYGGRVSVGHATSLSAMPPERLVRIGERLSDAGVALTVLPATDLYMNGRDRTHLVPRGIAPAHAIDGIICSIGTNNVLNPFTPFGDASLIRMANLYANAAQLGSDAALADVFKMISRGAAQLVGSPHSLDIGGAADLIALNAPDAVSAIREVAQPLAGWKAGVKTFQRPAPELFKSM